LEEAVELDPNFGFAHLLLAEIHSLAAWIGYDDFATRQVAARAAIAAAEEAVSFHSLEKDKLEGLLPLQTLCVVLAWSGKRDEALAMLPMLLEPAVGARHAGESECRPHGTLLRVVQRNMGQGGRADRQ